MRARWSNLPGYFGLAVEKPEENGDVTGKGFRSLVAETCHMSGLTYRNMFDCFQLPRIKKNFNKNLH